MTMLDELNVQDHLVVPGGGKPVFYWKAVKTGTNYRVSVTDDKTCTKDIFR